MKKRILAALSTGALAIGAIGVLSTPAQAAGCEASGVGSGVDRVLDQAWVSDLGHQCTYIYVHHYWSVPGAGGWTSWAGGAVNFARDARQAEANGLHQVAFS